MFKTAYETLIDTPIKELCSNDMGYEQMLRLASFNLQEKKKTLKHINEFTTGYTNTVTPEISDYTYDYTNQYNYLDYQKSATWTEKNRTSFTDGSVHRYNNGEKSTFSNALYKYDRNKYPDQWQTGTFWNDVIEAENDNSILKKTQDLFHNKKIKTIVDAFHTDPTDFNLYDGTENKTTYGLSHGRNLLTKIAEERNGLYLTNGYSNPYCRVWTHHHKYSDLRERLIRPFHKTDEDGNTSVVDTKDVHLYPQWDRQNGNEKAWRWKQEGVQGYEGSVLNHKTGEVNITPIYSHDDKRKVHTKDCMFSIENLAWQGYDPYSFEKDLSWEQRGPFGGRIMWFPPYGLNITEDTSVNWGEHSFIGRGENVYTYANTTRSGTLQFQMVVDHPSILDYATWNFGIDGKNSIGENQDYLKDTDILRFFAGCDYETLRNFAKPTPMTDELTLQPEPPKEEETPEPPTPSEDTIKLSFYVFYPNNYSGYYDRISDNGVEPIAYLLAGAGSQTLSQLNEKKKTITETTLPVNFENGFSWAKKGSGSDEKCTGYETKKHRVRLRGSDGDYTDKEYSNDDKNNRSKYNKSHFDTHLFIYGTGVFWSLYKGDTYTVNTKRHMRYYYRIDGRFSVEKKGTDGEYKNTYDQILPTATNRLDSQSFGLNVSHKAVRNFFPEEENNEYLFSLSEVAKVITQKKANKDFIDYIGTETSIDSLEWNDRTRLLDELLNPELYTIEKIDGEGFSNSHGANVSQTLNEKRNNHLAQERANTAVYWFLKYYSGKVDNVSETYKASVSTKESATSSNKKGDVSCREAKKWRSAKVTVTLSKVKKEEKPVEVKVDDKVATNLTIQYKNALSLGGDNGGKNSLSNLLTMSKSEIKAEQKKLKKFGSYTLAQDFIYTGFSDVKKDIDNSKNSLNKMLSSMKLERALKEMQPKNIYRYDQEYYFFKHLESHHPAVFSSLVDKLQYFDPAFHSMTPEGFMGRLNFLNQCTRQGATTTASDINGKTANNLAFGRPPFCVLRLGDFYYQKIVIRSLSITYDPLVLDLNQEGVGVVPLIANVSISFNFIGGGDITGPVRKLQNAVSENYYANGRFYNNRADRIERKNGGNSLEMGAHDRGAVDFEKSYFHRTNKANRD